MPAGLSIGPDGVVADLRMALLPVRFLSCRAAWPVDLTGGLTGKLTGGLTGAPRREARAGANVRSHAGWWRRVAICRAVSLPVSLSVSGRRDGRRQRLLATAAVPPTPRSSRRGERAWGST
jgi:hypothetical protein